jgi:hypothetical protein
LTAYNGSEEGWSQLIMLLILKSLFVYVMLVYRVSFDFFIVKWLQGLAPERSLLL